MPVDTDPVRVVVEIVDNFSDDLERLREQIRELDLRHINIAFDIDDEGDLESLRAKLRSIARELEVDIDFDIDETDIARIEAIRQALGRDMGSTLNISALGGTPFAARNMLRGTGGGAPGPDVRDLRNSFRGLGRTLVQYRPTIMDWWNVLALLIPIMITLAAGVVGVAAALGGVATAGAAVLGLGLLGWGDSFGESMRNLRQELTMLGEELFGVLSPASNAMQPLMQGAMRQLPHEVGQLVDELRDLQSFGGGLGELGRGFFEWIERVLQRINVMEDEILQVASRVGGGLGDFLISFLTFGLEEVTKNQEAYADLVQIFIDIISIIFNLSKVVTFVVTAFRPFISALDVISEALSNRWVVAFLTFITTVFLLSFAFSELFVAGKAVQAVFVAIQGSGFAAWLSAVATKYLPAAITMTWQWVTSLSGAYAVLAGIVGLLTFGLGLLAAWEVAGDMVGPDPGSQRGGGTTVNDVRIDGVAGKREVDRLRDMFPERSGREASIRNVRSR